MLIVVTNTLIEIFRVILQVSNVQAEDDFFALGGDSAIAVALVLEIERQLGVSLPISIVFDTPTPAALAQAIESHAGTSAPVILLKAGSGAPALFVMPGVSGLVMELTSFARLIDTGNPVYAIQAKGVDGKHPPLSSIEEMAEYSLKLVRATQPHGPYLLAGYSLGGLVALELAQRLRDSGEDIALLAMLDTYFQPEYLSCRQWLRIWGGRLAHHARHFATLPADQILPYAARRTGGWLMDIKSMAKPRRREATTNDLALPEPVRRVIEAGRIALRRYRPRPYHGVITYVEADPDYHRPASPEIIWGDLAQRLIMCPVNGDHVTMMSSHAANLAHWISIMLRNAMTLQSPLQLTTHPAQTVASCQA